MEYHFLIHKKTRQNLIDNLRDTSPEELCAVAEGYSNTIFWNIAHCLATQQLLHYYLSGNPFRTDAYWINTFKKGTLPPPEIEKAKMEYLAYLLEESAKILRADYQSGLMNQYESYHTSFGLEIRNINEAIVFNNMHESLHYGYIMAQKRAVQKAQNITR
ncbi:MAG: DinB family protein [Bergeyella sp.]|nr:DinB family protein [Bergeyella sp.]